MSPESISVISIVPVAAIALPSVTVPVNIPAAILSAVSPTTAGSTKPTVSNSLLTCSSSASSASSASSFASASNSIRVCVSKTEAPAAEASNTPNNPA